LTCCEKHKDPWYLEYAVKLTHWYIHKYLDKGKGEETPPAPPDPLEDPNHPSNQP